MGEGMFLENEIKFYDDKLFLFNLLESVDISVNKVLRLYSCLKDRILDENSVRKCLAFSPDSKQIFYRITKLSKDQVTTKALYITNLHRNVIEKLYENYKTLNNLINSFESFNIQYQNDKNIIDKICYFIKVKTRIDL